MDMVLRLRRMWLHGATADKENFDGEDLRGLFAPSVSFREARFYDVDLSGGDFSEAQFYHARLHHSIIREVEARASNFTGSRLDHCDFSKAILTGATFFRSEITACNFRGADLQGCDFREARVRGGDFRGANLRGSIGLTAEQIAQAIIDDATTLP